MLKRRHKIYPLVRQHLKSIIKYLALAIFIIITTLFYINDALLDRYHKLESVVTKDRHGENISIQKNSKGQYIEYIDSIPPRVEELLLKKEDRFFYFHFGLNPFSILRAGVNYIRHGQMGGSSTLTQQLVKNLLNNEQDRTIFNKLKEVIGSFAIELFQSKKKIVLMYANTVFMGDDIQGLFLASKSYFGKDLSALNDTEITSLLATLSSPTVTNPRKPANETSATIIAKRLGVDFIPARLNLIKKSEGRVENVSTDTNFELTTFSEPCQENCQTTIDRKLTDDLRVILKRTVDKGDDLGMTAGSIIVIKVPENQLLAMVGTPIVGGTENGQAINMAIQPRPIGSTAKPFIYLEAFEKGARPYTLVNDREYKFTIGDNKPFYPKNYDGLYRGWVTLHYALSNSLNIPTVKTLEYVGLSDFYYFLEQKLSFKPLQDLDNYQYGIALGGLEMDPLTLAHTMTLFPNQGLLKPLQLYLNKNKPEDNFVLSPMSQITAEREVSDPKYIELVNRILNDRKTGVEQFGERSNLNLSQSNYAVKTGTSRDYHDSWTVGYTPDFLVAVWVGNAENKPLRQVTGQSGAGRIWNESMELLFNSEYNEKTPFDFSHTQEVIIKDSLDFALKDDVVSEHQNLIQDTSLITTPHNGDNIEFQTTAIIPLIAKEEVAWYEGVNFLGHGAKIYFTPTRAGQYKLKAVGKDQSETITIQIIDR